MAPPFHHTLFNHEIFHSCLQSILADKLIRSHQRKNLESTRSKTEDQSAFAVPPVRLARRIPEIVQQSTDSLFF